MSQASRPKAYELPCIFSRLVSRYDKIGLSACETSATQIWRHADSQAAVRRLPLFQAFMPELADLQSSLIELERTEGLLRSQGNSAGVENFANWNSQHSDRDKRIQEVINIAQLEKELLYEDI
ncbi:24688_t:CDS:2, partial [Dentiscutata erythropus]